MRLSLHHHELAATNIRVQCFREGSNSTHDFDLLIIEFGEFTFECFGQPGIFAEAHGVLSAAKKDAVASVAAIGTGVEVTRG